MQTATAPEKQTLKIYNPNGWEIIEHEENGEIDGNKRLKLLLLEGQKGGRSTPGEYVEKNISGRNVLNANAMLKLEKDQARIPVDFFPTGDAIYKANIFWGTKYKNAQGKRFVACLLCFADGSAIASYTPIDHGFGGSEPAVVWE